MIEIWLDCDIYGNVHLPTYRVAADFKWSKGSSRVHVWSKHVGLYGQWINSWSPMYNDTRERVLFVEDDIDISPYAWRWLRAVGSNFGNMPNLVGFTLEDETISKGVRTILKDDSIYMRMTESAWGFAPIPSRWKDFQVWFHAVYNNTSFHPYIKESKRHTSWYKQFEAKYAAKGEREQSMWSQWLDYYMYKHKLLCMQPNARKLNKENKGFEFNRKEMGLHYSKKPRAQKSSNIIERWDDKYIQFPKKLKIINYRDKLDGFTSA